ncbi:MAG TPA: ATP-dependent Clp protease adaptor ClpS [candidate division Zixibacteria bacterium]|nr:ATP-dependent Clp protease adaptor ClpS [candidate division Zixibacteria bacterium]
MRAETDRRRAEDTDLAESLEPRAKVFVHNDSVTPYDFVIIALVKFFNLDPHRAELVTLTAHTSGISLVAVLPLGDARKKVGRAQFAASLEGYPLMFTIEPE